MSFLEAFTGDFLQVSGDPERNSVVTAIFVLLGSRRTDAYPATGAIRGIDSSILNYGVGDLHQLHSNNQIDSYCHELAQRIASFDQRVLSARVQVDDKQEYPGNTLPLLVTVQLVGQSSPVGFATDIRLMDGSCDIQEASSA